MALVGFWPMKWAWVKPFRPLASSPPSGKKTEVYSRHPWWSAPPLSWKIGNGKPSASAPISPPISTTEAIGLRIRPPLGKHDLVITSYGTLVRDMSNSLNRCPLLCVIGDEAQHLKNRKTNNAKAMSSLSSEGRVLLTGTPIENSVSDLLSLLEFLHARRPP